MNKLEKILKACANRRRLQILHFLRERPGASVGEIAAKINLSFKATSKHLAVLFAADLVDREQTGLQVMYHLPPEKKKMINIIIGLTV